MSRPPVSRPSALAALACVLSLVLASPSRAAEPQGPAQARPAPLALAAAVQAERADLSRALQSAPEAAPAADSSKPFLKTRRGIVTTVLLAATLGWVIYSTSNEGVTSPANQ
jgi:hypothetical protein